MYTYMHMSTGQGRTAVVLFADVSSAYYCTRRDLAARMPFSDQDHVNPENDSEELCLEFQLHEPAALTQQGAHPWLQALTCALNQGTWMHQQGDTAPIATRRGTRPGSAWADLTFGVLVARILCLRDKCRAQAGVKGAVPSIPWDSRPDWGPLESPAVSIMLDDLVWADDLATCLDVPSVHDTPRVVPTEAEVLTDAFGAHGFQLSYGEKKTAALVCPKGPGARSVCRQLFAGSSTLTVLCEQRGPIKLPLVDCYKHLGVLQAKEGSIRYEIKARCAAHGIPSVRAVPDCSDAGELP